MIVAKNNFQALQADKRGNLPAYEMVNMKSDRI